MPGFRQHIVLGVFMFLVIIPSFFGGEWSKWLQAVILVATSLLAFYTIILAKKSSGLGTVAPYRWYGNPGVYLIFFLCVVIATSIFSVNTYDSFSQVFLLISYVTVFFGAYYYFRGWNGLRAIVYVIYGTGVIAALISIIMFLFQSGERSSGFLFNANSMGSYLLFSLPLGIFLSAIQTRRKLTYLMVFGTAIVAFAFILTYSYTGWFAFIVPVVCIVIFFRERIFTRRVGFAVIVLIVIAYITLVGFHYGQTRNFSEALKVYNIITAEHFSTSFSQRLNFDYSAFRMIADRPLTGFGLNTYQSVYTRYAMTLIEQPRYTHNYYLQTFAETGVVGGILFLAFTLLTLWQTFRIARRQVDKERKYIVYGLWLGLLGSSIHSLVDFGWQFPAVFIVFWLGSGLILSQGALSQAESGDDRRSTQSLFAFQAVLALVAVILLVRGLTLFLGANYFQQGEIAVRDGDYQKIADDYAQGWRYDPDPGQLVNEVSGLGIGYRVLDQDQQAMIKQRLQDVVARNPELYSAHFALGQLYFADKKYSDAEKQYLAAIEYNPSFRPDYYYSLALIYFDRQDYRRSKQTVLTVLNAYNGIESTSNPNLPTQLAFLHLLLGQNYQVNDQPDLARAEYEHALRLKPDFPLVTAKLKELE